MAHLYKPISVEDIACPSSVDEGTAVIVNLEHSGGYFFRHPSNRLDERIIYEWSCDPPDAGSFSRWFFVTTFTSAEVDKNTEVTLKCIVRPPGRDPIEKIKIITINDTLETSGWARALGSAVLGSVRGTDLAADKLGNIYLTGTFDNELDVPAGPASKHFTFSPFEMGFLAKFSPSGEILKLLKWDETGYPVRILGFVIDEENNIFLTGDFEYEVDLDPGPGTDSHSTHGSNSAFLVKLDSDCTFQWSKTWGGYARGLDIASDGFGNLYLSGCFTGFVDFQLADSRSESRKNSEKWKGYVARSDSAGNFQWVSVSEWTVDDGFNGTGSDIDVSNRGNVYWLSSGPDRKTLVKLDSLGNMLWQEKITGTGISYAVGCDHSEKVYAAGGFREASRFINPSEMDSLGIGPNEWFNLISFDPDGKFRWLRAVLQFDWPSTVDVAVNEHDEVFVLGFSSMISQTYEFNLMKFDPDGSSEIAWSTITDHDYLESHLCLHQNDVYIATIIRLPYPDCIDTVLFKLPEKVH